ncbi:MAG: hypothetical protein AAF514_12800, partial [Verrucomicrobiota bacterium]
MTLTRPLPLLAKELTERAASPRTYLIRTGVGLALGIFFFSFLRENDGGRTWALATSVFWILLLLFLPAISAGTITAEKERDSLSLLFLTDLSGSEIILQKFFGALIPALSFIFLLLPLGALSFSLGGLEMTRVAGDVLNFILISLLVSAIGIRVSCSLRTTVGALVLTYSLVILGFFIWWFLLNRWIPRFPGISFLLSDRASASGISAILGPLMILKLGVLLAVFILLHRSVSALYRRAFVGYNPWVRRAYRRIDRFFVKLNQRFGGVRFGQDRFLPLERPIQWREINRLSLGNLRYWLRWWIPLQTVFTVLLFVCFTGYPRDTLGRLIPLFLSFGAFFWLVLTLNGVNAFQRERREQTLDILLTTPVSRRSMVEEKVRALWRISWLFLVPLWSGVLFSYSSWEFGGVGPWFAFTVGST